jgi:hypothetical protein
MTAAQAIGWEFLRRHRLGFIALVVSMVVVAAIKIRIVASGQVVTFDSAQSFAVGVVVPLTAAFTYCLAVFTFGMSGDLAARRSMYPARMFTLPVPTSALVGWPMLYGAIAMVVLWICTRLFAIWPADVPVPVIWPAFAAVALLAWAQALTWMPYGLRGIRVVAAVLALQAIDGIAIVAVQLKAPEWVMITITAPLIPLAYVTARYALSRARHGAEPDWSGVTARLGRLASFAAGERTRERFASAAQAQTWFEWRETGRSLPAIVAILLPFELVVLLAARNAAGLVFTIVFIVLVTPPFMAGLVAASVGKSSVSAASRDAYGVAPFLGTRPLTSAELIAAKLRMTVRSTLVAWVLVLVALPVGLHVTGTWPTFVEKWDRGVSYVGTARMFVGSALLVALFIASTWKQLVQTLYIGLTGRDWLIKGTAFGTLLVISLLGPALDYVATHRAVEGWLWSALPWILATLVVLKTGASTWVATRLARSGLLSESTLVLGATAWCAIVFAMYFALRWFFAVRFFPTYILLLLAILFVPLARVSSAPLALAWNRHR